jgi:hypothetical protein
VRRTGPAEPVRLAGPIRPGPAQGPPHAGDARCCAPGAAWPAPEPSGQLAGHGTVGRLAVTDSAAPGRTRASGWRMVGRALVCGGFLLGGWLVTSAGHAYASQITAPPAPHQLLTGVLASGSGAAHAGPPLAVLPTGGSRTVGSLSTGALASAVPGVSSVVASPSSGHVGSLLSGLGSAPISGLKSASARLAPGALPTSSLPPLPKIGSGAAHTKVTIIRLATGSAVARLAGGHQARPGSGHGGLIIHAIRVVPLGAVHTGGQVRSTTASPATSATTKHARRAHHAFVAAHRAGRPHRVPANGRPGAGPSTQPDPASAGGGTGMAQASAPALPGSGGWNPAGRLVRPRMFRWPLARQGADDPAVSPD